MLKIKMVLLITSVVAIMTCGVNAPARTTNENFWIGYFEHEDGGGKSIEQFEIKKTGGKLTAIYKSEVTAIFSEHYSMNVEIKGDTAFFYFDRCLSKGEQDYDPNPCNEITFVKGDLMFKLIKPAGNKSTFRVYGEKLASDFSSFKKVKKFLYSIGEGN